MQACFVKCGHFKFKYMHFTYQLLSLRLIITLGVLDRKTNKNKDHVDLLYSPCKSVILLFETQENPCSIYNEKT